MGQGVKKLLDTKNVQGLDLIGGLDANNSEQEVTDLVKKADLIIDFSQPIASLNLFNIISRNNLASKKVLLCTTGFTEAELTIIRNISVQNNITTLKAANTSLGILILHKLALRAAETLFEQDFNIEIIETHHKHKKDAPSGTAKLLADSLAQQLGISTVDQHPRADIREENVIGVHAVRGGGVFGEHEIRFISEDEEICLSHRALSRTLFAKGALVLARVLNKKSPGFYDYDEINLEDI